jgi:hypothetical protein
MAMKRFRLITAAVLLSLLSFAQSCGELDPKCENAKYAKVELFANPTHGDRVDLKWHQANKKWFFYHEYQTGEACGQSTLDLTFSYIYDQIADDRHMFFSPYLMINGEEININPSGALGVYGMHYMINRGGFYKLYKMGTPSVFNIRCGVELSSDLQTFTEDEAISALDNYLSDLTVTFEYLKLQ